LAKTKEQLTQWVYPLFLPVPEQLVGKVDGTINFRYASYPVFKPLTADLHAKMRTVLSHLTTLQSKLREATQSKPNHYTVRDEYDPKAFEAIVEEPKKNQPNDRVPPTPLQLYQISSFKEVKEISGKGWKGTGETKTGD